MDNHLGKGLMAGLNALQAESASRVAHFGPDYKRGFVLSFPIACLKRPTIGNSARGKQVF